MVLATMPLNRLDGLRLAVPHVTLGSWPTRVERIDLPGLANGSQTWVKREDMASSLYGGNKVRKLEFLLAAAAGPVLTIGAMGSHHVLATAVHAHALGRECAAILVPQPSTAHSEAVLALNLEHCIEVIRLDHLPMGAAATGRKAIRIAVKLARRRGATILPPGGSTPLGALGYVNAGLELAAQVAAGDCPRPDSIYVPLGSGGTVVGLALGLGLAGLDSEVVAVRVASRATGNTLFLRLLTRRIHGLLARHGLRLALPQLKIRVVHHALGRGYGYATAAGEDAERRAAAIGLPCESTYTAKTLGTMIAEIEANRPAKIRMFLDTYGPIDHLQQPSSHSGKAQE